MALGAQSSRIVRSVMAEVFAMLVLGGVVGLGLGIASEQYIEALLYQVKATDFTTIGMPVIAVISAAVLASLPPLFRAVRINPVTSIRAE
jgi:ABC-type antimicrobial peptide transport system permease subunit